MFFGGLLLLGARLGDRFGHRRIILTGLAFFTVAAVVGATAASVVVLTAARCLQGAAAALSVPSALRLLTTITSDGPQRERAIAAWSASGAAAGASGFVVGGVVTYLVGRRCSGPTFRWLCCWPWPSGGRCRRIGLVTGRSASARLVSPPSPAL
jgi:MFS family permease